MKFKIPSLMLLLACFIIIAGITYYVYNANISTNNKSIQEKKMVNIALSNDIVQSYIDNKTYTVYQVNTGQKYILFYVGNTSEKWNKLLVGIDLINNNTTYVYLTYQNNSHINPQSIDPDKEASMINIALANKTLLKMINNQRFIIGTTDLERQAVWFKIGEPYYLHQVVVGVDVNNKTTTYVGDMGNLTPPQPR